MNFVVRKGTSDPVSAQIARQIADAISSGEFAPGEKLPSVRKLTRDLGVAYNTVLRVYSVLAKQGLVYSVPSTGVFVAHDAPPPVPPDDSGRERKHWIRLAEALIVQSERCGLGITDFLAEVRLRAKLRARKREEKGLERAARVERREAANVAAAEIRKEREEKRLRRRPLPPMNAD